jgi:hypothetical protein
MNSKSLYVYLVILITLVSCNPKSENEPESKDNFLVTVEGIFTKNDKIQIYFLTEDKNWNDENSVVLPVYASSEMQKFEIELPEKIIPINIRVDVGENKYQSNITIKNISIHYKEVTVNGDNGNFTDYFYPNEFITWDPIYFGYKLNIINNNYDPFFMGNDSLISELEFINKKPTD